jgi:hypothetical protein
LMIGSTTPPMRVTMVLCHSTTCTTRYWSVDAYASGDSYGFLFGLSTYAPAM